MTADEESTQEDDLASILAACDEALAGGDLPRFPDLGELTPDQARLVNNIACVRLLRDAWASDRPGARKDGDPPKQLGRFQIVKELGRGGFGVVHLAFDPQLARPVALKVPRPDLKLTDHLRERFQNEAKAAGGLDHPNLIPVYDAGEAGGIGYIASVYCPGPSLAAWLKNRSEPVSPKDAAGLVAQLAVGVEHAHQRQILHRDLKPSNVLLWAPPEGGPPVPKLTDFGLAKNLLGGADAELTATDAILGTPNYLAPEQAAPRSTPLGPAVDVYGLGAILYELLTRRPPFESDSVLETLRQVRYDDPIPLRKLRTQIPLDLETICLKCLEKEPTRRYSSAAELSAELRRFLEGRPIVARPPAPVERAWKWVRRRPTIAALFAGLLVSLCSAAGLGAVAVLNLDEARSQAAYAAQQERERFQLEQAARKNEEREKEKSRLDLARFRIAEGGRRLDTGDLSGAAVWFASVLESETDPSIIDIHRIRIGTSLRTSPRPLHLFVPPSFNLPASHDQFASDGSCSLHTVRAKPELWSHVTGQITSAKPPDGEVWQELGLSSDGGAIIASRTAYMARAWSLASREPLPLPAPGAGFRPPFSPDGGLIASIGSDQRSVSLSSTVTGKRVGNPMRVPLAVLQSRFTPDGRRLVVTTKGGTAAYLFDTGNGNAVGAPWQHTATISSVVFSPDGSRIATLGNDRTVQVWDAATGRGIGLPLWHNGPVKVGVFGPRQMLVTAGSDHHARVWAAETGSLTALSPAHKGVVSTAAFHPDGTIVATGGDDGVTHLWDPFTGQPVAPDLTGTASVKWLFFSQDGRCLTVVGADGRIRIWDVSRSAGPVRFKIAGQLLRARWNPDSSSVLATSNGEAELRTPDGRHLHSLLVQLPLVDAVFGPAGRVITAEASGLARIWDAATGKPVGEAMRHPQAVRSLAISPNGRLVATTADDNIVRLWDGDGRATGREFKMVEYVSSTQFCPDNRRLLVSLPGNALAVYDAEIGERLKTIGFGEQITSMSFSEDGRRLALGSYQGGLRVWDWNAMEPTGELVRHGLSISQVEMSKDGRWMVSGGSEHSAQVWDVATGRPTALPMQHLGEVVRTVISPDGRLIATGSEDRTARVWETATGHPVTPPLRHNGSVIRVAFSPDGRSLLTAQKDGSVYIWDIAPDGSPAAELADRARLLSGRRLDQQGTLVPLNANEERELFQRVQRH
ncbi:MAG: WD40 repeat domain-containing serine/threonine-protein kinase [Gemmataceae bacterium]